MNFVSVMCVVKNVLFLQWWFFFSCDQVLEEYLPFLRVVRLKTRYGTLLEAFLEILIIFNVMIQKRKWLNVQNCSKLLQVFSHVIKMGPDFDNFWVIYSISKTLKFVCFRSCCFIKPYIFNLKSQHFNTI